MGDRTSTLLSQEETVRPSAAVPWTACGSQWAITTNGMASHSVRQSTWPGNYRMSSVRGNIRSLRHSTNTVGPTHSSRKCTYWRNKFSAALTVGATAAIGVAVKCSRDTTHVDDDLQSNESSTHHAALEISLPLWSSIYRCDLTGNMRRATKRLENIGLVAYVVIDKMVYYTIRYHYQSPTFRNSRTRA